MWLLWFRRKVVPQLRALHPESARSSALSLIIYQFTQNGIPEGNILEKACT
jgi:hypothetical protein